MIRQSESFSTRYLIRFSQTHETFRRPEIETIISSLGCEPGTKSSGPKIEILDYRSTSPFCTIEITTDGNNGPQSRLEGHDTLARQLISRSILARSIHQLYTTSSTGHYTDLHDAVKSLPDSTWTAFHETSFRFSIDAFCGKRSTSVQREIVEGFGYLPFKGRIRMNKPDVEFVVCEEWKQPIYKPREDGVADAEATEAETNAEDNAKPLRIFFGRYVSESRRDLILKHDLKKRPYISTTSMDAELALVTAVLAKAEPGKLFLDPFTGTGGFMVAAAELGSISLGSDIDGRSFRGKGVGVEKGVGSNFKRYGLQDRFGDCLTSDLTNTPLRLPGISGGSPHRWLDGIICDPPYGVREGLKVLGRRVHNPSATNGRTIHDGPYFVDGVPSHTLPDFIAPKRPYSFSRMLDDILDFAARTLVDHARLAFWMPCANDADEEFPIPGHPMLELKHDCIQGFNKWSRRLLVYDRLPGLWTDNTSSEVAGLRVYGESGHKADELNPFRRLYFRKFAEEAPEIDHG